MKNKKLKAFIGAIAISIIGISSAYGAGWSTYSTSYDMTGGIYTKKTFYIRKKMYIDINPTMGTSDCSMDIYKYTNHWYGTSRDECIATVSSVKTSSTVSKYKGSYGIYLRNWSGSQWTGNLTITYK